MQQTEQNNPHPVRFSAEDTLRQLDGYDIRILEEINFLSTCQAKKSPIGARYCCPGEAYLGAKIGLARENVSRHISKLGNLGILEVTHRAPIRGHWRTNLYKIRSWIFWRLGKILRKLRFTPPRVTLPSHKQFPKREEINPPLSETAQNLVESILQRWSARGT